MKRFFLLVPLAFLLQFCTYSQSTIKSSNMDSIKKHEVYSNTDSGKVNVSDEEWKKVLSPDVYHVAREKGTERAWSSPLETIKDKGTYYCAVCGNGLFVSDTKFESGCGWPSFYQPISKGSIIYAPDNTYGMQRTEVMCGRCKSHLGHVFEDGPPPTGLRYCINGVVLDFKKAQEAEKKYEKESGDRNQKAGE
ncbi:MAG: peptide-methionine (R)-S-oxide reductase [Chitinophagaceae bacterium]|nr:MAG: peptide-methionine (R)-S-oxide reductase [Chitinophagaceae bacterium]